MPRLESFSEGEFMRDVERLGGQALKQDASVNAGIPDRLCWLPGATGPIWFWAEWKRAKLGRNAKHQDAIHRRLRAAGHTVYTFDNNERARLEMGKLLSKGVL